MTRPRNLELAVIGNARIAALIDDRARVVWMCVPALDGDPVFAALLGPAAGAGSFGIELLDHERIEQAYVPNTPMLRSVMTDRSGGAIEVVDFAPRFYQYGRMFAPVTLVRRLRRLAGRPRVRVLFDPVCDYGTRTVPLAAGSHHLRLDVPGAALRLTTDVPITRIIERQPFFLDGGSTLILGPDETLADSPASVGRRLHDETLAYWHRWVRNLAVPFEWQDEVIRAAITLKLNTFDDTGGIVAAVTTSIPEAPGTERTWDYRYCWLRDAYFVVNALNRLGATASMERFLAYLEDLIADTVGRPLQPVYSLSGRADLREWRAAGLAGFGGTGPVRVGNDACLQTQHDVYGAAILGVCHVFFDRRMNRPGDVGLFERLEALGERAFELHEQPDAGIWEFRGRTARHTFSALMCWAACDRLARVADRLGLPERATGWRTRAATVHRTICERAWRPALNSFAATFEGDALDASLLLMAELDFLAPDDERLRATVDAIERALVRGRFLLRYAEPDDFGAPQTAFLVCTFWLIQALARIGQTSRARELFQEVLACRNAFGLLSEDIDPATGELWGNFPQTYSMVGIVMCATRLSRRWEEAF